jgi:hypothetical protein
MTLIEPCRFSSRFPSVTQEIGCKMALFCSSSQPNYRSFAFYVASPTAPFSVQHLMIASKEGLASLA